MSPTASDLPELRFDPLNPRSFAPGQRSGAFHPFEVFVHGLLSAGPLRPIEHWAVREWNHEGFTVWVTLDATGTTIIDPASHRQLTAHHLAIETLPVELVEILDELDALGVLSPEWYEDDLVVSKASSVLEAKKWVRAMYEDAVGIETPWHKPHVAVDEDGGIMFEWWNGEKALTVYVSENRVRYIRGWGLDIETEMEDGEAATSDVRRILWTWLLT